MSLTPLDRNALTGLSSALARRPDEQVAITWGGRGRDWATTQGTVEVDDFGVVSSFILTNT